MHKHTNYHSQNDLKKVLKFTGNAFSEMVTGEST